MTVNVIVGPSCSGKSTYAWGERGLADVVIDYDRIARALGSATAHRATGDIARATWVAREAAISSALKSEGESWVLHSRPTVDQVEQYEAGGVRFLLMDTDMDTCLKRAEEDDRPEGTEDSIRAWFDNPPVLPDSTETISPPGGAMTFTPRHFTARAGQQNRDWCRIEAKADGAQSVADVYLYDEIGYWGTSASDLVQQLADLDVDAINLFINSPGGDAWDGVAMMNVLRRHKATVHVTVDGIAASAASLIAMAGDTITMARGSEMMIHDASGMAYGNAATMTEMVNLLDKLSDSYAATYAARAGGDPADWRDIMRAETWYTAAEAVTAGLADRLDDDKDGAKAKAKFDLSMFSHAGRRNAPAPAPLPAASLIPPASEPGQPTHQKKEDASMASNPEFMAGLRERLGITDATLGEDGILAALSEALTEQADTPPTAELPEGVVTVEASVLAGFRERDAHLCAILAERDAERREVLVAAAVADGRIPPARKDHWLTSLAADEEGFAPVLAALSPGVAVPLAEVGHSNGVEDDDDRFYNTWTATPTTGEDAR